MDLVCRTFPLPYEGTTSGISGSLQDTANVVGDAGGDRIQDIFRARVKLSAVPACSTGVQTK